MNKTLPILASSLIGLALLTGCNKDDTGSPIDTGPATVDSEVPPADNDGDGYVGLADGGDDCDDDDPAIFPGAEEACDGVDNDCNGAADEGWPDTDSDDLPDCLDAEDCDAVDNDGDGEIDEDFGDSDDDGVRDCFDSEECDAVDNDGDGNVDEGYDADGDGYTTCGVDGADADCDDTNAGVNPGAAEIDSDEIDNDCDGLIDGWAWAEGDLAITELMVNPEAVPDPVGEWIELINNSGRVLYLNGLVLRSGGVSHQIHSDDLIAVAPGAYAVLARSADPDENGGVSVDAVYGDVSLGNESDEIEIVADGVVLDSLSWDDGATMPDASGASLVLDVWFNTYDQNDDPYHWCAATEGWSGGIDLGSPGAANQLCPTYDHDFDGYPVSEGDCDDDDPTVSPGVDEIWYDGFDQNCDEWPDYDADYDTYDSDAYGGTDCDDTEFTVNVDAEEICDGLDNDCNGEIDGTDPVDVITWYADDDRDDYGDPDDTILSCSRPLGYIETEEDCDDADPAVNPDADEICGDGVDNNCNIDTDGCGLGGELSTNDADGWWYGENYSNYAGISSAIAPDIDGDGNDDLVIGAYYASGSTGYSQGAAYVVYGPGTGTSSLADADAKIVGATSYDYMGYSVDGAGDVNGDGYGDVIVGAYGNDNGGSTAGAAYLFHGPVTGDLSANDADAWVYGQSSSDYAGYSVSRAGDVNDDGYDDVLVGAYYNDGGGSSSGAAYLLMGPVTLAGDKLIAADARWSGATSSDYASRSLDTAGDVDGDGNDDILVGAYYADGGASYSGEAYLIYGPGTGITSLRDADASLEGEVSYDYAGQGVSTAGDVNDDGYDDILVGAYYGEGMVADAGKAYLVLGPVTGRFNLGGADAELLGATAYDYAGFTVSEAGDVDNDGYGDVLVGAYGYDASGGSTNGIGYLLYGPLSGAMDLSVSDGRIAGESSSDYAGYSLGGDGDVDGDGYDDIIMGAYYDDDGGSSSGAAFMFLGGIGY